MKSIKFTQALNPIPPFHAENCLSEEVLLKPPQPKPWVRTPLIFSPALSSSAGCNIYLKLENTQPSGSFKSRGIGNLMVRARARCPPGSRPHFLCSSGGNAGLACATTAQALKCPATIVVPTTTSAFMICKLQALNAKVIPSGASWAEADAYLKTHLFYTRPDETPVYVPPFDHQDIWDGAATMIDEVEEDMMGKEIHAVVCNVGGGGLLNGVFQGLEKYHSRKRVKVLAMETVGADSLNASIKAGQLVTLPAITSIATSLGARRVSDKTWEWATGWGRDFVSATVTDAEAAMACVRFLDDARAMVEVACGATVATAYNGDLKKYLGQGLSDETWAKKNVVLVVCGGSHVSWKILEKYKQEYGV